MMRSTFVLGAFLLLAAPAALPEAQEDVVRLCFKQPKEGTTGGQPLVHSCAVAEQRSDELGLARSIRPTHSAGLPLSDQRMRFQKLAVYP